MSTAQVEGASSVYLRAIRTHRILVIAITLLALAGALLFTFGRSPSYQATTEVLVSPLPQDDQSLLGLPVIRDTPGDPTRGVQTAATLLESTAAAEAAGKQLNPKQTEDQVLAAVNVEPRGQSNILAITGTADTGAQARDIANDFTNAALRLRNDALQSKVDRELAAQRKERDELPPGADEAANQIAQAISRLQTVKTQGDPTLAINEPAKAPGAPTDTPAPLIIVLALLAGLALGAGAAVLRELTDRAVRDEAEAVSLFPVPILARVPQANRKTGKADAGWHMPPAAREAFRTVLAQIEEREDPGRALMVLSATTGDGKTTSAIDLAVSVAASGRTAVLLDLDLRKPSVAARLGITDEGRTLRDLIDPNASLADLVRPVPRIPSLSVLTAVSGAADAALAELLHSRLPDLIAQARLLADYVVIDTAPLGEVSDALRVVHAIDETIVVMRPGSTDRLSFETMRDLLERSHHVPLGLLVIGVRTPAMNSGYYGYGASERELFRRSSASATER